MRQRGNLLTKEVKPRDMHSDYQTRSLHYFHTYAVHDHVNIDHVDDSPLAPDQRSIKLKMLFPSKDEFASLLTAIFGAPMEPQLIRT